ncbi:MAG: hypothetical protein QOE76_2473 [Frankiales bacterium]|jgi:hypothetical protein|nr:hypothetical protein [Frankiales bacterium]
MDRILVALERAGARGASLVGWALATLTRVGTGHPSLRSGR